MKPSTTSDAFLDPLANWPVQPPAGYMGQLDPDFQARRASMYAGVDLGQCDWYHTTELPDGTILQGEWDLRGAEADYLGRLELAGSSVLEFGPATGYLTYWMESQGASVTSFEVGYDAQIAMVPPIDRRGLQDAQRQLMTHVARSTNAWWLLHRMRGSAARMIHGDIYQLPDDLGMHDVSVLGCILVHLRDPFLALAQAAAHTSQTLVVVEQLEPGIEGDDPLLRFGPDLENPDSSVMWWHHSPGSITAMLWRLGFERTRLVRHTQRYHVAGTPPGTAVDLPLFTIVAERRQVPELAPSVRSPVPETHDRPPENSERPPVGSDLPSLLETRDRELAEARNELSRLRATRTFRWSAPVRRAYGAVRHALMG